MFQTGPSVYGRHGDASVDRTPSVPLLSSYKACDRILYVEASKFGKDFLRMAGIVQMLHTLYSLKSIHRWMPPISNYMPTEREQDQLNINPSKSKPWYGQHNEIKLDDKPSFRLRFLDHVEDAWNQSTLWIDCPVCLATRLIIYALALYGLYSLLS